IEDIENNYPSFRFVASANTHVGPDWNVLVRASFYGSHYDERGTIDAATQPSAEIDGIIYFDLEVGYQYNDNLRFVAGASNIFDTFVDEIGLENANRLANGLQYPRRTAANYEGGSWYFKATYKF
ncbi:MAG: TonB-dependent receptor, partial [Kordiimonadaceae bacterium]|nr:TonB-dependent receptor [Kordiimonadaceae bacterium]